MDYNIIGTQWASPQREYLSLGPWPFIQCAMFLLPLPVTWLFLCPLLLEY